MRIFRVLFLPCLFLLIAANTFADIRSIDYISDHFYVDEPAPWCDHGLADEDFSVDYLYIRTNTLRVECSTLGNIYLLDDCTDLRDFSFCDYNGDSYQDVVAGGVGTTQLYVWTYDPDWNNYSPVDLDVSAVDLARIVPGDVDADGDLDFVGLSTTGSLVLLEQISPDSLELTLSSFLSQTIVDLVLADFDGDGDLDAVVPDSTSGSITYAEYDGVWTISTLSMGHQGVRNVQAIDFDADGDLDILAAEAEPGNRLSLLDNDGTGSFDTITLLNNGFPFWDVHAADFDLDGDIDILAAHGYDPPAMYEATTDGYESLPLGFSLGDGEYAYFVDGLDERNDGDLEPLITYKRSNDSYYTLIQRLIREPSWQVHALGTDAYIEEAGDADGDGDIDLLGRISGFGTFILENYAGNGFIEHFISTSDYQHHFFDEDSDGDLDLIDRYFAHVLRQVAPMTFVAETAPGMVGTWFATGDINYNNLPDILTEDEYVIYAYERQLDGSYDLLCHIQLQANFFTLPAYPSGLVDFDRDGDNDIVMRDQWVEQVGPLQFETHGLGAVADMSSDSYVVDWEGDGDLDLAMVPGYNSPVPGPVIRQNDGNQNFTLLQVAVPLDTDNDDDWWVADVDLDGDGDIIRYLGTPTTVWFEHRPGEEFVLHPVQDHAGMEPTLMADMDLDGDLDMIYSEGNTHSSWLENPLNPATLPAVEAVLVPFEPPVIIPPFGGYVYYDLTLRNLRAETWSGLAAEYASGPNGNPVRLRAQRITLTPYRVVQLEWQHHLIPASYPPGDYQITVYLGQAADSIEASDSFSFTKLAGVAAGLADTNAENSFVIPTEFALYPASPNPFNAATTITVDLPQPSILTLNVYNLRGQLVASLADGTHSAARHRFSLDASHLASGMYLIHANVPGMLDVTQKAMLLK